MSARRAVGENTEIVNIYKVCGDVERHDTRICCLQNSKVLLLNFEFRFYAHREAGQRSARTPAQLSCGKSIEIFVIVWYNILQIKDCNGDL